MALSMPDRGLLAIAAAQDPRIIIDMAAAKGVEPPMLIAGPMGQRPPKGAERKEWREQRRGGDGIGAGMGMGVGAPGPGPMNLMAGGGPEMAPQFDNGMGALGPPGAAGGGLSQFFQPQNASAFAGLRPPAQPQVPMPATPSAPQPSPIQARPDLLMQLLMGSQSTQQLGLPQLMGR